VDWTYSLLFATYYHVHRLKVAIFRLLYSDCRL